MWSLRASAAVIGLISLATLPTVAAKPNPSQLEEAHELQNATQLERRIVCGAGQSACGQDGGYTCCEANQQCSTNAANQAICIAGSGGQGGQWSFTTIYYTSTDLVTRTTVLSTYIGGAAPTPQPSAACGSSQTSCGALCCDSGYWCQTNVCKPIGGGTTPVISATGSPTTTVPFSSPIATGANGTAIVTQAQSSGLSGGAIAGIVIGVIAGIILLLLICFYCCAKAAFDSVLALIGLGGKKKRRHEESTYIEEHHRHSGSAAAAGGRRWYGQGSSRPSRPPMKEKSSGMGGMLGLGAGLAGLAAVLGMKRKHDARHDDKSTTISGSSYYYSDYTSSSSASSDDRRTRHTRQSSRR